MHAYLLGRDQFLHVATVNRPGDRPLAPGAGWPWLEGDEQDVDVTEDTELRGLLDQAEQAVPVRRIALLVVLDAVADLCINCGVGRPHSFWAKQPKNTVQLLFIVKNFFAKLAMTPQILEAGSAAASMYFITCFVRGMSICARFNTKNKQCDGTN